MAFDDTFRPRSYIHEHDTFDVLGKPKRVREIKATGWDGPVAEWADYRGVVFDEIVAPVISLPEANGDEIHRVAWVYHAERDPETHVVCSEHHHIACDCSMMAELSGEPESIYECDVLQKALNRQAGLVRGTLLLDKILRTCRDSEESRTQATFDRRAIVAETIIWILKQDAQHPESWMGNIISGEHTVSLLGLITQEPPEELRPLLEDLEEDGRLDLDEEVVRLRAA